ncbi:hypothetical protein DA89_2358 [Vibrio paracholerae]|nr:hypothetical protein DA89_2358 [Vibrio paracholerae]
MFVQPLGRTPSTNVVFDSQVQVPLPSLESLISLAVPLGFKSGLTVPLKVNVIVPAAPLLLVLAYAIVPIADDGVPS